MRCVAGAGLLVLVGCNQVFGITPTKEYDASVDVVPDSYVKLTWQVATILASGDPSPAVEDQPIVPPPRVRHAALLDDHFTDATYSPDDGSIVVPRDYFVPGTTWRLEYTLADGVPHEAQWSPDDKQGHLTVPIFGRLERDPVPMGGGYTTIPSGATSYRQPRMFTTGLWTEGVINNYLISDGAKIDYDFYNAVAMSGPNGRPDPLQGDHALLVDFMTSGGCRVAAGSAALDSAAIEPSKHSMALSTWDAGTKPVTSDRVDLAILDRLTTTLGKLHNNTIAVTGTVSFGIAINTSMPGLPGVPTSPLLQTSTVLPTPVMLTLLQCPYTASSLPNTAQPALLDPFSRILHVQLVDTRQVLGVSLNSGMETAIVSATATGFKLAFPAAIPTNMTLTTPANGPIDLAGATEQVGVGATNGSFTLTFTPEMAAGLGVDYYDVTLHRLDGGTLTTERIYTVTAPKVQIDGALLAPQAVYVFQIRSFKGHPSARQGDLRPVSYPYGSAIVFTRTFKTP